MEIKEIISELRRQNAILHDSKETYLTHAANKLEELSNGRAEDKDD